MRILLPAALALALASPRPAAADDFVSVDEAKALAGKPNVRFVYSDAEKDFDKGHLPGSVAAYSHDLHLLDDVHACKGLPMCEPRAAKLIGETLGVDASTDVIVYDSGIGVNASGNWFFLKLYGVKSVRILDGGLATWKARGGPVETGAPAKPAAKAFAPQVQWDMVAGVDEVKKAIADSGHYLLLDSRHTLDEYTGKQLLGALASPGKEQAVKRGGAIPAGSSRPGASTPATRTARRTSRP